jgi:hypothetical protein
LSEQKRKSGDSADPRGGVRWIMSKKSAILEIDPPLIPPYFAGGIQTKSLSFIRSGKMGNNGGHNGNRLVLLLFVRIINIWLTWDASARLLRSSVKKTLNNLKGIFFNADHSFYSNPGRTVFVGCF